MKIMCVCVCSGGGRGYHNPDLIGVEPQRFKTVQQWGRFDNGEELKN